MSGYAASEITALATKAARGAGVPPEQAARYGAAAAHHLAAGRSAAVLLSALISGEALAFPRKVDACRTGPHPLLVTALMQSYLDAAPFPVRKTSMGVYLDPTAPRRTDIAARLYPAPVLIEHWQELAARTFVPETETSRIKGAGAGLRDND